MTSYQQDGGGLIELSVEDDAWSSACARIESVVENAAASAVTSAGLPPGRCAVSILLTDDETISGLNARFREKDAATNVLSWPAFDLANPLTSEADLEAMTGPAMGASGAPVFLGDVALAFGVVSREAENDVKSLEAHVAHLIVHGVLHLLGYDHEDEDEAEAMMAREIAALSAIGVADPYAGQGV